jgi:bifunctional non-homologous end joining protein LigD
MGGRLGFIEPLVLTLVDTPPRDGDWSTEVKFDGWHAQIIIEQGGARVFTRPGHDWTDTLKIVAGATAEELKLKSAIIDDELVYPHETGLSDSMPYKRS